MREVGCGLSVARVCSFVVLIIECAKIAFDGKDASFCVIKLDVNSPVV